MLATFALACGQPSENAVPQPRGSAPADVDLASRPAAPTEPEAVPSTPEPSAPKPDPAPSTPKPEPTPKPPPKPKPELGLDLSGKPKLRHRGKYCTITLESGLKPKTYADMVAIDAAINPRARVKVTTEDQAYDRLSSEDYDDDLVLWSGSSRAALAIHSDEDERMIGWMLAKPKSSQICELEIEGIGDVRLQVIPELEVVGFEHISMSRVVLDGMPGCVATRVTRVFLFFDPSLGVASRLTMIYEHEDWSSSFEDDEQPPELVLEDDGLYIWGCGLEPTKPTIPARKAPPSADQPQPE